MSSLDQNINRYKPELENYIQKFLSNKIETSTSLPEQNEMLEKLKRFSLNGKLLRGILVLITSEFLGETKTKQFDIATAIEITHSALLIHDDILDKDELRRGARTIHAQFRDEAEKLGIPNSDFFGQGMAICVGDIAFFLAFELLANSEIEDSKKSKIIKIWSKELQSVGAAEMTDFYFGEGRKEPSIEDVLKIYKYKSARYTFSLPFKIGGIIASANEKLIEQLELFGEKLGIVFQIKDDELGLFGDEQEIGKPVGSDIRQNKKTIFRALLLKKANAGDQKIISKVFGKQNINQADMESVKSLIEKYNVRKDTNKMVADLLSNAKRILSELKIPQDFRTFLSELIEYNSSRNK